MLQTAGQHHEREEYEPLLYGTSVMLAAAAAVSPTLLIIAP